MSPDHVIKGTYSSNEAAQPTEPSACPADWTLLGNINTWTRPWVEDRRKLCPLHTHNSSSRARIQAEMTPGQTILSPKALGSLKSLRQSRASDACVMAHLDDRSLDCALWTSSAGSLMACPNSAIQALNPVSGCRWEAHSLHPRPLG